MSVLIKGMKMPQDGRRHKALVIFEPDGTCKIVCEYSESYSERHIKTFEAIELPPHGRLIDADAMQMEWFNLNFDRKITDGTLAYWNFQLSKMPIIIPAEEVYGQYTDTAGNFHWCGTHSGEHTIKAEEGE